MSEVEVQNGGKATAPVVSFSAFKPQLVVEASKAVDAVEFYKSAFAAEEIGRTTNPKRKADQELPLLLSADLKLGSSIFSVSGAEDDSSVKNASGCLFSLETEDVEAAIKKAVSAGAVAEGEVVEGEGVSPAVRMGKVKDPYGFIWMIGSAAKTIETTVEA
ncbi:hypothetical protein V2J09_022057 [Rumex salicifolius]